MLFAPAGHCDVQCTSHHKVTKHNLASPCHLVALLNEFYSRNEELSRWIPSDAWVVVFCKRHTQCSCYKSLGGSLKSKCFHSKQNLLQKFCWREKSCFLRRALLHLTPHCIPDGILSSEAWEKWQTVLIMTFAVLISQAASIILASLLCERSQSQTARTLNCGLSRDFTSASTFSMASNKSVLLILLSFPSLQNRVHVHSCKTFQRK